MNIFTLISLCIYTFLTHSKDDLNKKSFQIEITGKSNNLEKYNDLNKKYIDDKALFSVLEEQTQQLRFLLTEIIQKVTYVTSFTPQKKEQIKQWAFTLQNQLKLETTIDPTMEVIDIKIRTLIQLNWICSKAIQSAIQTNFSDLTAHPKKFNFSTIDSNIDMMIRETREIIPPLHEKIQHIGLSRFNKCARHIEFLWKKNKVEYILKLIIPIVSILKLMQWMKNPAAAPLSPDSGSHDMQNGVYGNNRNHFMNFMRPMGTQAIGITAAHLVQIFLEKNLKYIDSLVALCQNTAHKIWNKAKNIQETEYNQDYVLITGNETISLTDANKVIGLQRQLDNIMTFIENCKYPERFEKTNGGAVILSGPSGTGKTFFAKLVANTFFEELSKAGKSIPVRFQEVGNNTIRTHTLRSIIANARKMGGVVILFIDEFHTINVQTNKDTITLNEFLTQISDLYKSDDPNSYVLLLAATNQQHYIDTSLTVPGRFDIIHFSYPNEDQRKQFLATTLSKYGASLGEFNFDQFVHQTQKFVSYGKLQQCIKKSATLAAIEQKPILPYHLQKSIDLIIHNFTNNVSSLTQQEIKMIAAYQASKALTYALLNEKTGLTVERVTIGGINPEHKEMNEFNVLTIKENPNKNKELFQKFGAIITSQREGELIDMRNINESENRCKALVAGSIGQNIILKTQNISYKNNDIQQATQLLKDIFLDGKNVEDLSKRKLNEMKDFIDKKLREYEQEVTNILNNERIVKKLRKLIEILEQKITIAGAQVYELLNEA